MGNVEIKLYNLYIIITRRKTYFQSSSNLCHILFSVQVEALEYRQVI